MQMLLFGVVLAAALLLVFGNALSTLNLSQPIWPPPQRNSWQFWFTWILSFICMAGIPAVWILDAGSLGFNHWSRWLIGFLPLVFSIPLATWSVQTLGAHQSAGIKKRFVSWGPYHYSRNPQYIVYILLIFGIVALANSVQVAIIGGLFIIWTIIAPFSEEKWLSKHFGSQYDTYKSQTPRFMGRRKKDRGGREAN